MAGNAVLAMAVSKADSHTGNMMASNTAGVAKPFASGLAGVAVAEAFMASAIVCHRRPAHWHMSDWSVSDLHKSASNLRA
jgi:hypothetical protein